jgi:hypothetical protein
MIEKRGYSPGREFPFHFDVDREGWYVFDSRTNEVVASKLTRWEAYKIALDKNGLSVV